MLIHARAGGVGHIAVQLAKLHGCRVVETVKSLPAGEDAPLAFDSVGGDLFVSCLGSIAVNVRPRAGIDASRV